VVPEIETARLRLRRYEVRDLEPQAAALAVPEVVRFLGGTPHSREETWRRILAAHGLWGLLGFGYWVVERKTDGAYLGHVGFADFKRQLMPSIEGIPEAGWIFAPQGQNQGYATEAVQAALAWADEHLQAEQVTAIISHDNIASIRVAEKCGFAQREEAIYKDEPILLFRRHSPAGSAAAASTTA
jgi:RimJ/RimL family protein N-acetyltransferase